MQQDTSNGMSRMANTNTPLSLLNDVSGMNVVLTEPVETNGLPYWWELQYFGTTNVSATADSDEDGLTNLQEFMRGSSPNRATVSGSVSEQDFSITTPWYKQF